MVGFTCNKFAMYKRVLEFSSCPRRLIFLLIIVSLIVRKEKRHGTRVSDDGFSFICVTGFDVNVRLEKEWHFN